jgi:hypothetical protein
MIRLDRTVEAADKSLPLTVEGQSITVDALAIQRYRKAVDERPIIDL